MGRKVDDSSRVDCLHGMILGRACIFAFTILASIVSHHPLISNMGLHSLLKTGLNSSLAHLQIDPTQESFRPIPDSVIGEDVSRVGLLSMTSAVLSHVAFLRRKIRSLQIRPLDPPTQGCDAAEPSNAPEITTAVPDHHTPPTSIPPHTNDLPSVLFDSLRRSAAQILADTATSELTGDKEIERQLSSMLR